MKRLIAGLVLGIALQPLLACATRAPSTHEFILDNGLKLIVHQDHRASLVHTHLWYRSGSNQEEPGKSGLAHAVEHMQFNGSSKLCPGESDQILQYLGGSENATTEHDATLYFQTTPPHALAVSFEMLADQMSTSHLTQAQWMGEREVIKSERSEVVDNNPVQRARELLHRLAHPASPQGSPIIGWLHDLERLHIDDLKRWYQQWYAPNNAILVVAGDVQAEQVKALADRYFGPIPRRALPVRTVARELAAPGERSITQYIAHQPAMLYMAFNVPSQNTQTAPHIAPALELLSEMLAGGDSSLLKSQLWRSEGLVTAITTHYNAISRGDELFNISAMPDMEKAKSLEAVKERIIGIIDTLKKNPPALEDLERARTRIIARRVFDRDELFNQASRMGELEVAGLSWQDEQARLDVFKSITPQDIQHTAQTFLSRDRLTTSYALPEEVPHD